MGGARTSLSTWLDWQDVCTTIISCAVLELHGTAFLSGAQVELSDIGTSGYVRHPLVILA